MENERNKNLERLRGKFGGREVTPRDERNVGGSVNDFLKALNDGRDRTKLEPIKELLADIKLKL